MKNIDMSEVERLYYDEEMSTLEVGLELGVSAETIQSRMKSAGMQLRTRSEAQKCRTRNRRAGNRSKDVDVERAAYLYFEREFPTSKIGEILGVSSATIRNRLKAAGYTLRGRLKKKYGDSEITEMVRLYCEEELSTGDLAYRYGCRDVTIRNYLKQRGVRLRTSKECQELRRKKEASRKAKVSMPVPKVEVTPAVIVQLRKGENLTIDVIAEQCGLENIEVYTVLQSEGVL